jgi:hypothetical protein
LIINRPAVDPATANQETPMKFFPLATVSALSLALITPASACPGNKAMQNADAGTAQSEKPAEVAAAQTPMPAEDATTAAQPAEVAAAPASETPAVKN